MKTKVIIFLSVLLFAMQWAIPLKMIYDSENVLISGKAYRFKTQPIDPTDPFRGAFIILNYEIRSFPTDNSDWAYNEEVYVSIKEDSLGFAKAVGINKERPIDTDDYVTAYTRDYYNGVLNFHLPFDRFYMEETKAYDAELAYLKAQRDTIANNSFALVYVKKGNAVLADVLVNGSSVVKLNSTKD
ncbi:GDYXXLXY domain-containing protein [Ascidiimonas sp. W6]|uniref:GDYXXLXY domain-containing protein n=1 Tax=Ascidiimonas meishanensis TaxID=3128903 RepID=UPI0030EF32B5